MLNTVKNSQDLYKNRPWLKFLELVTLGTVGLAVCALLLGCGSDSSPGGSAKGKNVKPDARAEGVKALLIEPKGMVSGKVKTQPEGKRIEVIPQFTREELEAKIAANQAQYDPKLMEPWPGAKITHEQLKAKVEANQAQYDPKLMEPWPGAQITHEQLRAKIAENQAMYDPKRMEPLPGVGITQEQWRAKIAENQAMHDPKRMQTWPGAGKTKAN